MYSHVKEDALFLWLYVYNL